MPRAPRRSRAAIAAAASALAVLAAGCSNAASAGSPTASPSGSASATASADPTPTQPPQAAEPGGGHWLFPSHRLVMFYGAAGTSALGVLGAGTPEQAWTKLTQQAKAYDQPGVTTVPSFELIADVEQGAPGPDGDYSAHVPDSTIAKYYQVAHAHHGMLVLDIQPGRSKFLPLAKDLQKWLLKPDVGLALDPEWKLYGSQVPDVQIGHTTADVVNSVSAWLEQLVEQHNLPQKLLLVHDFTGYMVKQQDQLVVRPRLALALNMDGFGHRADKVTAYKRLAGDERMWLGFKLFYRQDIDMFTPAEMLALDPAPNIINYQ